MVIQQKQCKVCGDWFSPDKRVGERQQVCKKLACQQERKRRSQAKWLAQNQGYFAGRYQNTKMWLARHPGYLCQYRKSRRQLTTADIQDELTFVKSIPISELHDIQDEITLCFQKHLSSDHEFRCLDIQDELTLITTTLYLAMIYKARLRF